MAGSVVDELLAEKGERFVGILNGIDTVEWDPGADPHLAGLRMRAADVAGKAAAPRGAARRARARRTSRTRWRSW